MFKVPNWDSDIPNNNVRFKNKTHNKKDNKREPASNTNASSSKASPSEVSPRINHIFIKQEGQKCINNNEIKQQKQLSKKRKVSSDHIELPAKDLVNMELDEAIIRAKKKKYYDAQKIEDEEKELFSKKKRQKVSKNKIVLKKMLKERHRRSINVSSYSDKLRSRMLDRLKAAQFRYLNEKLYTSSGNEAKEIFQKGPSVFKTYHQGYQQQVKKWPVNPLDIMVKKILRMPQSAIIADMGCGEAALSKRLPHIVKSFDLVATAPGVVVCDMAHTPLQAGSVDVAVYCLALMGTELTQYLVEANRILKVGGQLLIAEVESRFDDVNTFTKDVEKLGFKLKSIDNQHSVFFFLHFVKNREPPSKKGKLPALQLKPCLYKRR